MRRCIQGVLFEVPSPSAYIVAHTAGGGQYRSADVTYADGYWLLTVTCQDGKPMQRAFPTRDEAIGIVATAFRNVGLVN